MKLKVVLLAYGEMAIFAYRSLSQKFVTAAVIVPPLDSPDALLSPVVKIAKADKVEIIRTNANSEIYNIVKRLKPEALVICSYNKILPPELLNLLPCVNVHHGDLPRWRGRANLNWAIITGKESVGLTIHEAVQELDAGNIYSQYIIPIGLDETIKTLYAKINVLVEKNLGTVVEQVISGYEGKPQKGKPTYCCTRLPDDGLINWNLPTRDVDRFIRALTKPFPGAFTFYNGKRMIIWSSENPKHPRHYEGRIPGRVILLHRSRGVEVLTGDSSLIIKDVTYKGKNGLASEFIGTVKATFGFDWVKLYEGLAQKT